MYGGAELDSSYYSPAVFDTIGVVFNSGPRTRKSRRQDSRARGPLLNTTPIVGGDKHDHTLCALCTLAEFGSQA